MNYKKSKTRFLRMSNIEEKEKPKKVFITLSHSQKDLLKRLEFTSKAFIEALTHAEFVFYSGRIMANFYQEEVSNMQYKSKFLQFKFWCTKLGGDPIQQQPYLKKISKEQIALISEEFDIVFPEANTIQIELKRKAEKVTELENVVGELSKKLKGFEELIVNLAGKTDLSALLGNKEAEPKKGEDSYIEEENFYTDNEGEGKSEQNEKPGVEKEKGADGKVINFELLGQLLSASKNKKKTN